MWFELVTALLVQFTSCAAGVYMSTLVIYIAPLQMAIASLKKPLSMRRI